MLRTGLRIPSPLTPCYFNLDASFISRLANTDDKDRPIYGLSAQHITNYNLSHVGTLWAAFMHYAWNGITPHKQTK